jgi:hypothetical protein
MAEPGHDLRCDYSMVIVPRDAECYCPTEEERAAQAKMRCLHQPEEGCECADYENEG